jgi:hypothetical protein
MESTYWRFYKVKSVIVKSSENKWKGIFIAIIPENNGSTGSRTLLDNNIIKITEEIRPSDALNGLISDLFHRRSVVIANKSVSTELFIGDSHSKPINRFDSKLYLGSDYPGEVLFVLGVDPGSDIFEGLKEVSDTALLTYDPPFENIEDAIDNLLNINPNIAGYLRGELIFPKFRPLLLIFNPYSIRFENAEIIDNKLNFETVISYDIKPEDVSISIIGRMKQKTIRKLIGFQKIKGEKICPIENRVKSAQEKGIKIVTGDVLSNIVLSIRSDTTLTKDQIHKLLIIAQNNITNWTPKFEDHSLPE